MKDQTREYRESFTAPETVEEAWHVGRIQAECGYRYLTRAQFFENGSTHPFPSSVYRAYVLGHRRGVWNRRRRGERIRDVG